MYSKSIFASLCMFATTALYAAGSIALLPVPAIELAPPDVQPVAAVELAAPNLTPVTPHELTAIAAIELPPPGEVQTQATTYPATEVAPAIPAQEANAPTVAAPSEQASVQPPATEEMPEQHRSITASDYNPAVY